MSNPKKSLLFDLSPGTISRHITCLGKSAEIGFVNRLKSFAFNEDCSVSGIIDFWSARQVYYRSYGAILATGIDSNWHWFSFPVSFFDIAHNQSHTAEFIFSQFDQNFCSSNSFANPLFVCTDNAASMIAAFDGRFRNSTHIYRMPCVEHRLSTCINDSFKTGINKDVDFLWKRINAIETFYNSSSDKAASLKKAIPQKCVTREWRSHNRRLLAIKENFSIFLSSPYPQVQNNIPDIATVRGLLLFFEKIVECFDVLEVDGPTAHLVLPCYCLLDYFSIKLAYVDDTVNDVVKAYAIHFRAIIAEKLWPICGSKKSIASSYLAGINVKGKIERLVESLSSSGERIKAWALSWEGFINSFQTEAERYILEIFSSLKLQQASPTASTSVPNSCENLSYFLEPPTKKGKKSSSISDELCNFRLAQPDSSNILQWWSAACNFSLLQRVAKIVFGVPASSAAIERLFSSAGLRLSKHRPNTSSNLLRFSLFLKCAEKAKLDVSVSQSTLESNEILDDEFSDCD